MGLYRYGVKEVSALARKTDLVETIPLVLPCLEVWVTQTI